MDGFPIGQKVRLAGHFDGPVTLESVRSLGSSCECRARLADGSLEEAVLSQEEAQAALGIALLPGHPSSIVDPENLRLLAESARIRLAHAYDRQFAVGVSGIRTLPR